MKALRLLFVLVACAVAPRVFAASFDCPDSGNPGYIGLTPVSVFLDLNPAAPDSSQRVTFTVGKVAFAADGLSTQLVGTTINVFLTGHDDDADVPPDVPCLATSVGPLTAGSYGIKIIVIPDDSNDEPPYVAAQSSLDVAAQTPGSGPLPITGQMTSNWYDPDHSGEGIVVQIAKYPPTADGTVFDALVFDWFTYDTDGNPFWISGNATIDPENPTSVTVPAVYRTDGGFAGDFGAESTAVPWGTVTFTFPDPNHMTADYDGTAPPDATNVPSGTGTLHYERLLNIDGLQCDPITSNCTQ